jgi:hypothetical protein
MKTLKSTKWFQGSMISKVTGFAAVAVLSLLTSACGNNSGGTTAPGVGVLPFSYGASCAGCSGMGGQPIASAVGQTTYYGMPNYQLQITFYGAQTTSYMGAGYSGQLAASAQLVVQQNMNCGIPAGVYTLQTAQPGTLLSSESFYGLTMIGMGPTQIQFTFVNNFLNNGRVQGSISVSSNYGTCTDTMF